ncbi:2-oxoacid:ferredoxin oxidoreductase subunit beta [Anoxynatronum buryatiense]|uniref:2-oxoglutarate ferredoxin oxidoreductase subunit beta n=1 Tax=Anoxynatronum buryatiense TaxID=489973 RepID=A0AA45WTH6_9CLOT|nr:2-oxoacid:ferredoxin oxidoreductase subunit beta [Anoxynatronum buryatiense]SMP41817.1 2-oxoglutarate ferredoxin oxidoreductase subunit beta [Anoxynatronum buryatiense]
MTDPKCFNSTDPSAWCPGCGNHALLADLKEALAQLDKNPHEVLVCSGIGQAAKTPHYLRANGFNGLHGRSVPPAFGAKVANKELTVIINSGDGDSYGEGGNHLIHNMRRNLDVTHFVHDNMIYGLTKGQASPTTRPGHTTGIQTEGVVLNPLKPLALAITMGATFVARGFVGEREQLIELMKAAITHPGYALVDIFQPCVVFNKVNTFKWYQEHTYQLPESYDPGNRMEALQKAFEWDDGIPLGVLYREERPTYTQLNEVLREGPPLVDRRLAPERVMPFFDDFR